jgi:hypothetical protein
MCFRRVSCRGKAQSPIKFDRKGFCDTVYNVRKAYRYRAIALIEICQFFLIAPDQCLDQYAELLR